MFIKKRRRKTSGPLGSHSAKQFIVWMLDRVFFRRWDMVSSGTLFFFLFNKFHRKHSFITEFTFREVYSVFQTNIASSKLFYDLEIFITKWMQEKKKREEN